MTVYFVGAGPGAADLITIRARNRLASSTVCLYAGSLVPPEVLAHCPPDARLIDTANLTLEQIVTEMIDADRAGRDATRLHSGDPSLFSAVAEQMRRLDHAGVRYEVVPGVPAFAAAAASLRRELTVPGVGQTIILTRIAQRATPMPAGEDLATLGRSRATLVLHLAVQRIEQLSADLIPNYGAACPVAVVAEASRDSEVILRGTLADIAGQTRAAGIVRTAVVCVGEVLAARHFPDSHLYSASRIRHQ
jgi:precorrin-4/cobalt-precorrin-4 C11-methyltransferase